jgi:hypothetical protein
MDLIDFNASDKCSKQMAEVQPVAWIEKIVEDYQRTGTINMDELIKLLGDPNGSVSFSDPLTAVRDAISATYPTAMAK